MASKPTHWMDPVTEQVVTDEFMRSPRAHSDYQLAYSVPCVMRRGKPVPIKQPTKGEGFVTCGGCGNSDPDERCMGCRHDFGGHGAEVRHEAGRG
jgi:hypothetical protein